MSYDYLFKFIVIGDQGRTPFLPKGVGKTTLLKRFADNSFTHVHEPTLGVEFLVRTIEINGVRVRLQIWDTVGYFLKPGRTGGVQISRSIVLQSVFWSAYGV